MDNIILTVIDREQDNKEFPKIILVANQHKGRVIGADTRVKVRISSSSNKFI